MTAMDGTDDRDASEAPSSSSDFYNMDTPDNQHGVPAPAEQPRIELNSMAIPPNEQDDGDAEDSSSEMDLSASSRSSSPEPPGDVAQHTGTKRKLSDADDADDVAVPALEDPSKKRKLSPQPAQQVNGSVPMPSGLPVELWQQILLYLPPAMLCRCLRVSRTFNGYLTRTTAAPVAKKSQAKQVRVLDSEAIWTQARKNWFPNLPKPLLRCTELKMLQLIGGSTCQFCNRPTHVFACHDTLQRRTWA